MKILQVINIGYPAGGAEISALLIRDELRKRGHEVKVLSSDMQGAGKFNDFDLRLISSTSIFAPLQYLFYFHAYRTMRKVCKEFQPDVIHFHTVGYFSPSIFFAVGRIPSVMTVHGPEHFTLKLLPWCIPVQEYGRIPFDLRNLSVTGTLHYAYLRYLKRPIYLLALRRVKVFIAPSKYLAKAICDDVPTAKIIQIYNGISLPPPQPLPSNCRVLYVGRLEEVKGVEYLIRAFADVVRVVPNATLRIVGDGTARAELVRMVSALQLSDRIEFVGWVRTEIVKQEYTDALILVTPSIWPENLPTVCIEALAAGRPVVGTDAGGIPELVIDGKTGRIVPTKNSQVISEALISLLSDRSQLDKMSKAATASSKRFGVDHFIDQIECVYKGLI